MKKHYTWLKWQYRLVTTIISLIMVVMTVVMKMVEALVLKGVVTQITGGIVLFQLVKKIP